ncbi:hypothetical protein lpari_00099 [Legionella parisiensis]|uniref:Uncharacterized protein n=1 Tax=Legionella parisiensis TaxID=45071 RepID=A0A1E5JWF2_9GAMM|nr:hypothetical protein [Legionella parisiensis]OEH48852.1 hypothetical protein lpari_00099 [Legionella parisiensis]STX75875.1 Uncharacterised protein [Legionella parisiensis]
MQRFYTILFVSHGVKDETEALALKLAPIKRTFYRKLTVRYRH